MDYEYEDPAEADAIYGEDAMEVDQQQEEEEGDAVMEDEDIPVTQEDAWAVIRYAFIWNASWRCSASEWTGNVYTATYSDDFCSLYN